jgi:hypothetical protein
MDEFFAKVCRALSIGSRGKGRLRSEFGKTIGQFHVFLQNELDIHWPGRMPIDRPV